MIINKNAKDLCKLLNKYGYEAYFVGGCVRDILLNNTPHDIDITTNATPIEIKNILNKESIEYFNLGEKFGTIVPIYHGEQFEVTTFRTEQNYSDGRHPDEVKFTTSLKEDLARRDFTINAMALDPNLPDMKIIDPFGGMEDIKNNIIRAVGNPNNRFTEDGLRILRAIRFAVRYGFNIDTMTGKAMLNNKSNLDNISKERITDEFKKIFSYKTNIKEIFDEYSEIIFEVFPEMKSLKECKQNNPYHYHNVWEHSLSVVDNIYDDDFILNLAGFFHDIGKPRTKVTNEDGIDHFYSHPKMSANIIEKMCSPASENKKLILSSNEYKRLYDLVEKHDFNFAINKKQLKKCLVTYGEDFLLQWKKLANADFDDHIIPKNITKEKLTNWHTSDEDMMKLLNEIHKENTVMSIKDLALNGNDLINMGIQKGPQIGILLKDMFNQVLDEKLENTKETLTNYVNSVIDKENTDIDEIER